MTDKEFLKDEVVLIEHKDNGPVIILKEHGAFPVDEKAAAYLDKYNEGDKVEVTVYGEPRTIFFIKKAGTYSAPAKNYKKPETISKDEKENKGFKKIGDKYYATLEALLNRAWDLYEHRFRIRTKIIELNVTEKFAVIKATVDVIDDEGRVMSSFDGIGDSIVSIPDNTGKMVQPAFIRMAETRAIVRALRWATNIADTGIDEIGDRKKVGDDDGDSSQD